MSKASDCVPATELIVVRHGETIWNAAGRQQGHADSDLTPTGLRQAELLADALSQRPLDALYSSDLGRAMRTAQCIADRTGLAIRPDARLRERNLGVFQGLTPTEVRERFPDEQARLVSGDPDYVIPGGESARQRYDLAVECAEEVAARHPGERVLLVTHGGVLSALFRRAVGLPLTAPRRCSLYNVSINTILVTGDNWMIATWGDVRHLSGLASKDESWNGAAAR